MSYFSSWRRVCNATTASPRAPEPRPEFALRFDEDVLIDVDLVDVDFVDVCEADLPALDEVRLTTGMLGARGGVVRDGTVGAVSCCPGVDPIVIWAEAIPTGERVGRIVAVRATTSTRPRTLTSALMKGKNTGKAPRSGPGRPQRLYKVGQVHMGQNRQAVRAAQAVASAVTGATSKYRSPRKAVRRRSRAQRGICVRDAHLGRYDIGHRSSGGIADRNENDDRPTAGGRRPIVIFRRVFARKQAQHTYWNVVNSCCLSVSRSLTFALWYPTVTRRPLTINARRI